MLAQMPIVTAAKGYVNKFWKASSLVSTMPPAAFGRTHRVATARCSRPATEEENRQHRKKQKNVRRWLAFPQMSGLLPAGPTASTTSGGRPRLAVSQPHD
jgi:hypothetical protein